ncbi:group II intron maturase-specific domain-containing protein [Streptomyces sp. CBMA123]|uniref:group II intron maturase-specific domain-containing protein n=1 Tax=Streptomyces sp. CBMA123 TaxID=1896313 RepID=UPI001661F94F|nr:group II intron maturase-specific domain-containing protein [Streptomyces sp. CBMA123]
MTRAALGPHSHPLTPADLPPGTAWWSSCPDCRSPIQGGPLGLRAHRRTAHRPDRSFIHEAFTFLGYTFRARKNRSRRGNVFLSFEPGISREALTRIGREVRSWHLHTRTGSSFVQLARRINPVVAGWINYYGRFRWCELEPFVMRINAYLVRWIRNKYKRFAGKRKALAKMQEIARRYPRMFAQWRISVCAVVV